MITLYIPDSVYDELEEQLQDESGNFTIEDIQVGSCYLTFEGHIDYDSYHETDAVCGYGNGTGAWVNVGFDFSCELTAVYDEDGEEIPMNQVSTDFDEERLSNEMEDLLDIGDIKYAPASIQRRYRDEDF